MVGEVGVDHPRMVDRRTGIGGARIVDVRLGLPSVEASHAQ
jgi:hypothetical protein